MKTKTPYHVHPGEFIEDELKERGWTQSDLAAKTKKSESYISRIIKNKRSINPKMAVALSKTFGTSARFWLNLETSYQLYKLGAK